MTNSRVKEVHRSFRTVVFRGEREGRSVFIKQPAGDLDERTRCRYRREYELLRRLPAESVPQVVALVDEPDRLELVMLDDDSRSLSRHLEEGSLTVVEVVRLLRNLVEGLARLHREGVVHKKLSPDNLLWHARTETVRFIDFEAASTLHREYLPGDEGCPGYMPPEQTRWSFRPVTILSDFYGLGAVAWHLLVGRPPFPTEWNEESLKSAFLRRPVEPRLMSPEVPANLSRLVWRLMSVEPRRRFLDHGSILRALSGCLEDSPPDGPGSPPHAPKALQGCLERAKGGDSLTRLVGGSGPRFLEDLAREVLGAGGKFGHGYFSESAGDRPHAGLLAALPEAPPEEALDDLDLLQHVRALTHTSSPLVLFIENVELADSASFDLLTLVATDPESGGILLLLTCADGERALELEEQVGALALAHPTREETSPGDELSGLAGETLDLLAAASLAGRCFDCELAARLSGLSPGETAERLWPALNLGILAPSSADYRLLAYGEFPQEYRFVRPSLQDHLAQTLAPGKRSEYSLRMARYYRAFDSYRAGRFFSQGFPALTSDEEALEWARFALEQNRTTIPQGRSQQTLELVDAARRCCPAPDLALELTWECARLSLALGHQTLFQECLETLQTHSTDPTTRLRLAHLKVNSLITAGDMPEALRVGNDALRAGGLPYARRRTPSGLLLRFLDVVRLIGGRTPEDLLSLPVCKNPVARELQALNSALSSVHARICPEVIPDGILLDCRNVLTDGVTPEGAQCWTGYALLLCWIFGKVDLGIRFADLALAEIAAQKAHDQWPRSAFLAYYEIRSFREPLQLTLDRLDQVSSRGLKQGDIVFSFYATSFCRLLSFLLGKPLSGLARELKRTIRLMRWRNHNASLPGMLMVQAAVKRLQHDWDTPEPHTDWTGNPIGETIWVVVRLQSLLIQGRVGEARALAERDYPGLSNPLFGPGHFVYWTYALVAVLAVPAESRKHRSLIRKGRRMLKRWSVNAPFRQWRLFWLEALELRGQGRPETLERFELAIKLAGRHGFIQDVALMREQAAEHCKNLGDLAGAQAHLDQARRSYAEWEAWNKVEELRRLIPAREEVSL